MGQFINYRGSAVEVRKSSRSAENTPKNSPPQLLHIYMHTAERVRESARLTAETMRRGGAGAWQ